MLDNLESMFDLSLLEFRKGRKKAYEDRMSKFRATYEKTFLEMLSVVSDAVDKNAAATDISNEFCDKVFDIFAKRGKIRGPKQQDLCLFMIYYVFPAIQLTNNENATLLCDNLLEVWRVKFNNPLMNYGQYADLLDSFKEKIFGIF